MIGARAGRLGAARFWAAVVLACTLGGCVATLGGLPTASVDDGHDPSARPAVSPSGATVAFASIDGPPADVAADFSRQLAAAEARRDIVTADPQTADYLVRGYFSAAPEPKGTAITYVWDIFDNQKRHTERVDDTVTVQSQSGNPWSDTNQAGLAKVAAKAANDLAAYLSKTPQAMAAASEGPATPAATPASFSAPASSEPASQNLLSLR